MWSPTASPEWRPAPARPAAAPGEVHVWRAHLDASDECDRALSPDERARAARFRFERDRRRYVAGRALLRCLLARYTGADPAELRLSYGTHGKPRLDGPLRFNVAHADAVWLCAVTESGEVGADVEPIAPFEEMDDVAAEMFSAAECGVYRALPADSRVDAFAACWTRKEAFVKAVGDGLSYPLARFDVTLAPHQPPALLRIDGSPAAAARWRMAAASPAPGYAAAVVASAPVHQFHFFDLT